MAVSGCKLEGKKLGMEVTVPPNTTATIIFQNGRDSERVVAGSYRYELDM